MGSKSVDKLLETSTEVHFSGLHLDGIEPTNSKDEHPTTSTTESGHREPFVIDLICLRLPRRRRRSRRGGRRRRRRWNMKLGTKKGWKSLVQIPMGRKSATQFCMFSKVRSAGQTPGNAPVFLNVYDLTPVNGYMYWAGLGIFHSRIEDFIKSMLRTCFETAPKLHTWICARAGIAATQLEHSW